MEKICTLRELVEARTAESYFATALDRISIAKAFIDSCRDVADDKKKNDVIAIINPDIVSVKFDTDAAVSEYTVILPELPCKKELKRVGYDNMDYAAPSILNLCKERKKRDNTCEVIDYFRDSSNAYTIACLTFYIIFACHPLKGADYYAAAAKSTEEELKYFLGGPRFIFDPASYDLSKIEGYHKCPYDFWSKLSDGQRSFFAEILCGGKTINSCSELFAAWDKYFTYESLTLKAVCGENIAAYDFGEDHSIIATDVTVWNKIARCIYCKKEIKSKCKSCPYADKGLVEVTVIEVKLIVVNAALGQKREIFSEKIMPLKVGDVLQGKELDGLAGGEGDVFAVIPTKKLGVLGMEYLGDKVISIEPENGTPYVVSPGAKFKLVPGDKINVSDYIILEVIGKKGAKPAAAPASNGASGNAPVANTGDEKQDDDKD